MTLRLVIADDHSVVLQGLQALLSLQPGLEVAALCACGREAVEAVKEHRPDVLVLDATMPNLSGLDAYTCLRRDGQGVPTVVLTASLADETLAGFVRAGVEGIVLKDAAAADLVQAIRAVARGERWVGLQLTARALEFIARPGPEENVLTPREQEVVVEVAGGHSNRRVAHRLGISESTVKLHLHNAFHKLGVRNRVQLSLLAHQRGWME